MGHDPCEVPRLDALAKRGVFGGVQRFNQSPPSFQAGGNPSSLVQIHQTVKSRANLQVIVPDVAETISPSFTDTLVDIDRAYCIPWSNAPMVLRCSAAFAIRLKDFDCSLKWLLNSPTPSALSSSSHVERGRTDQVQQDETC